MSETEKLSKQQQKLNQLYMKALRQVVSERRRSTGSPRPISKEQHPTIKAMAAFRAALMSPSKKVYIKFSKGQFPYTKNTNPVIYKLDGKDLREWAKAEYRPEFLSARKKPAFQLYHNAWHFYPVDWREHTAVKIDSPEGEIISYKTIDFDKAGDRWGITKTIEAALVPKKNDMRHYKALLAESKKAGWPKDYATDLTKHDHRELRHRDPDLPFGWALRESGTHLLLPEHGWDNKPPSASIKSIDSFGGDPLFYTWDGTTLSKRSHEAWGEWMDRKYRVLRSDEHE